MTSQADVTTALATLGAAGFTCIVPSAYTGGPLASPGPIGSTVPSSIKTSNLQAVYADSSGTPGNVVNNNPRGRAAIAAAATACVVTNSLVTAASTILVQLGGADLTATSVRVTAGSGSFTVTANAAATGNTPFDYLVVN